MQRRHPHLTTFARLAAGVAIAGAVLAACGADGGTDVTLSRAAETGREVMRSDGCAACHGRNGEGGPGPTFTGLFGSTVELEDGTTVVADADYLFESIRDPSARIVDGYGFPMPTNDLSDAEIESVIAFIEELATATEGSG
jgi:mono/diheme cytochrome c family protein